LYRVFPRLEQRAWERYARDADLVAGGEMIPVTEILKIDTRRFPHADKLTAKQLKAKLRRLTRIMARHSFYFTREENIPEQIIYRYLTEGFLNSFGTPNPGKWVCHVTGCTGWCEKCFFRDWCDIEDEIKADSEHKE
jgi:hypothetical protein